VGITIVTPDEPEASLGLLSRDCQEKGGVGNKILKVHRRVPRAGGDDKNKFCSLSCVCPSWLWCIITEAKFKETKTAVFISLLFSPYFRHM
jgi:hypothetical protein